MVGEVVKRIVPEVTDKNVNSFDITPTNISGFGNLTVAQRTVVVASSITFLMGIFQVAYININFKLSHFTDDIKITLI